MHSLDGRDPAVIRCKFFYSCIEHSLILLQLFSTSWLSPFKCYCITYLLFETTIPQKYLFLSSKYQVASNCWSLIHLEELLQSVLEVLTCLAGQTSLPKPHLLISVDLPPSMLRLLPQQVSGLEIRSALSLER